MTSLQPMNLVTRPVLGSLSRSKMAARSVRQISLLARRQFIFPLNRRAMLLSDSRLPPVCSLFLPRNLCSENKREVENERRESEQENAAKDNGEKEKIKKIDTAGLVLTQGPIGWLTKTINLWLLASFFDHNFEEEEFLDGAKQALCTVSSLVSQRTFSDMVGLVADSVIEIIRENVKTQDPGPAIAPSDILIAKIKQVGLGYIEGGKKQIHIDVAFVCSPLNDGLSTKQIGNVKLVHIHHPRVLQYTFRKDCSSDDPGDWLVVGMDI